MKIFLENYTFFYISLVSLAILFGIIFTFKYKNKIAWTLQILSLFFLSLALCKVFIIGKITNQKQAFLIDISNSMPKDDIYSKIKNHHRKNNEIYLFSNKITPYSISLDELKNSNELKSTWKELNLNKTNIKSAISNLEKMNRFDNIFIYTDGYESKDGLKNFLMTSSFNANIYPITPDFSKQEKNFKENLRINLDYNPKGTLNKQSKIRITLENPSSSNANVALKTSGSNNFLIHEYVKVNKNDIFSKDFFTNELKNSLNKFSIEILNLDGSLIEKRTIYVTATKKENVLLLSNTYNDANFLEKIIKKLGYDLSSYYENSDEYLNDLSKYSLIILNNFPYKKLGFDSAKNISSFVKKGGKFLMVGGENSFGLGKYKGTPIEEILPVTCEEPKKEVERANLAIALILDNSASMSERNKINYLKLASKNLVKNLNDDDYLGIVGFSSSSFIVFPINKIKDYRQIASESIDKMSPFGGTNLMPAINDAIDMLSKVKAGKKHIIILTDGQIPGHLKSFTDVAIVVRMIGSTLSTVMLGNTSYDKLLKEMAKLGNGNYFVATDEKELPNIFIDDLKIIKDSKDIKENLFKVKTYKLKNTSLNNFPNLRGIINTNVMQGAKTELYVTDYTKDIPLLVSKDIEKGKTLAFTSDMNGRWSKDWIEWENIYIFWDEVLSHFLSNDANQKLNILDYDMSYYVKNNNLYFDINLFKNISFNDLSFELKYENDIKKLDLKKIALGHYIAKYENPLKGKYKAYLVFKERKSLPIIFSLTDDETLEEKHFKPNLNLLSNLALKHSGKINPSIKDIKLNKNSHAKKDISIFFIVLSLISLMCGIYTRER